jgi:uncharacterized protein (TIGR00725 family)
MSRKHDTIPTKRASVIGAGACDATVTAMARELGALLAQAGFGVVCGGLGGVMQAVCEGADRAGGLTIGILPGDDYTQANPFVHVPLATSLSHMRNYLVILNGDVVIAVEGGAGTLSELALAQKTGKTVIALGTWAKLPGVLPARDAAHAVELAGRALESRQGT